MQQTTGVNFARCHLYLHIYARHNSTHL